MLYNIVLVSTIHQHESAIDIYMPGSPGGASGKELTCQCRICKRHGLDPWLGKSHGEGMAVDSSILAWRIPWTEEPGGLQSIGLQRVRHDSNDLARMHWIF